MNRLVNQLSDIVDNGLCIGCGLCQSIAGKDKIEVSMTSKGRLEPKEISKITPEIFEKIRNVCPGTIVEGLPKENVDQNAKHNLVWGYYLSLCYTWSTDKKIRFESSTVAYSMAYPFTCSNLKKLNLLCIQLLIQKNQCVVYLNLVTIKKNF